MELDHARFVHSVAERTGLEQQRARIAVVTTFEAIGRALPSDALAELAGLLPRELGHYARQGAAMPASGGFLADLADHEQVSLGFAKEHAQVVIEQLATLYDEPTRARLRSVLAAHVPEAADWLVPWQAPEPRRPAPSSADDRTLAGGRPGSRSPISEAAPEPGQHDSPAVTSDPHTATRLSSTRGISSERERETIAEGRPGSSRPVSESHD